MSSEREFLSALEGADHGKRLKLDGDFFERVSDPFRPGQLFTLFSHSQRNFLRLRGTQHAFFAGDAM